MPTGSKKVRTVVWLPTKISQRLRHTKAAKMIPVTTQIEAIVLDHFDRKSQTSKAVTR